MIRSKNARQDDCRSPEERNKGFHAPGCLHALEWVLLPMWLFISQEEVIQHSKEWKRELTAHPVLLHPPYSPKIEPTTLMAIVIVSSSIRHVGWSKKSQSGIGIGLSALTCLGHCTPMMRSKGLWIYTVVARLCLLAVFIALVVLQTDFMPRPINTCWWDFTWPKNSNVPSSVPTIWEILPSHTKTEDGRYTSPHEVTKTSCELFLRRWRFELGMA